VTYPPSTGAPGPLGRRKRRLNPLAVAVVTAGAVAVVGTFYLVRSLTARREGKALLAQARRSERQKDYRTALKYLDWHLESDPDDVEALDLKGRILAETARSPGEALQAAKALEEVLRRDRSRREARRRLVRAYLRAGPGHSGPAEVHAKALVADEPPGATAAAGDYRLLGQARALKGLEGNAEAWREAADSFERALRLAPGDVEAAEALAYLSRERLGEPGRAAAVLDALLKADDSAAAHLVRFRDAARAGHPERARAELDAAVARAPDDAQARLLAAEEALSRGDLDAARRHIDRLPAGAARAMLDASVLLQQNRPEEAVGAYREALKATGGTSEDLTWRLAYLLLRLGQPERARPLVEQYHRLTDPVQGPPGPRAAFLDALLLLGRNDYDGAIRALEAIRAAGRPDADPGLAAFGPTAAEVALTLGQAREGLGDARAALADYREAARLARKQGARLVEPWARIARLRRQAGDLDGAEAALAEGLDMAPGAAPLLAEQVRLRLDRRGAEGPGRARALAAADESLRRALAAAPDDPEVLRAQVAYLAAANRTDEAARLLGAATEGRHAQDAGLWAMRAEVLRRLGRDDEALRVLDAARAAAGDQPALRIARAELLNYRGDERAALDVLREGLAGAAEGQVERRAPLLLALGDLHLALKDPAAARDAFARWAELTPDDPRPRRALLDLAVASGDEAGIGEALAALRRIGGPAAPLAEAIVLLRDPPGAEDEAARDRRLARAEAKVGELAKVDEPAADLLRGRLLERRGDVDGAAAAYRRARDRGAGPEALRRLVDLLARHRRFDDLRALRAGLNQGEMTPEVERQAALIALNLGEKDQAEQLARRLAEGHPESLDARVWAARILGDLGQPERAEGLLRDLIQQRPDELAPRLMLLMLQRNQKEADEAARTVAQIGEHIKSDRLDFILAQCYRALGDRDRADARYEASLAKWPGDPAVSRSAAAYYRESGRPREAEAVLRRALDRDPKLGWAARELALSLSARPGDTAAYDEALKLVGAAATADETPEDKLVRATVLIRSADRERVAEATRLLEGLLADGSAAVAVPARDLLAQVALASGRPAEARAHGEAAARASADPAVVAHYAAALLADKKPEEAARQAERLLALEPDGRRGAELLARASRDLGQPAETAAKLEGAYRARRDGPDGEAFGVAALGVLPGLEAPEVAARLARDVAARWPRSVRAAVVALAAQGRGDEAMALCRSAAQAAPREAALAAVALALAGGDAPRREAAGLLDAARKAAPEDVELLRAGAALARARGRLDAAVDDYRALLARAPGDEKALNNLAWTLSEDLNRPAEALPPIDEAIRRHGRRPNLLDTRGVILTRLGRPDEAIADLEAAAAAAPDAATYFHLARACRKAGRDDRAREAARKARDAGLTPRMLQPSERGELDEVLGR
jgi:tetratricopeptide (TPR) repeat protein